MLTVGIPKEIKPREKRVGLTPSGVRRLRAAGIPVLVEKGAGEGSGFSDPDYQDAGAPIVPSPAALYQQSGLIQKVKEPLAPEWNFLKPDLVLFSFLHLASPENHPLVKALLEKRVTALAFEAGTKDGRAVFLEPMSRIAGTLTAYFAAFFKQHIRVEKGEIHYPPRFSEKIEMLASQYSEVPEIPVVGRASIFGGGVVGHNAAQMLLEMGWAVDMIEKREIRRMALKLEFQSYGARFRVWDSEKDWEEPLIGSEVWIGAVHILGERAPWVVSRADLGRLSKSKPKLILDVAVDQGGNFPETHSTTYDDPLYLDSCGNLRFAVANIPSLCGRGASEAIERATLPYTIELAKDGKAAIQRLPELKSALQVMEGRFANETVARTLEVKK